MGERRVSKVCPTCGCTEFKKVRPKGWVAFIDDRKCAECGDCYTPPTPRWAAVCFIVVGVFLIAPLPLGIGIDLLSGRGASLPGWACYGLLATLGVASVGHGVRNLGEPIQV